MSEDHDNKDNASQHNASQKAETITDEVLEHIYGDLASLRDLLERNRATTELTQELVLELRKEVRVIQDILKINN